MRPGQPESTVGHGAPGPPPLPLVAEREVDIVLDDGRQLTTDDDAVDPVPVRDAVPKRESAR